VKAWSAPSSEVQRYPVNKCRRNIFVRVEEWPMKGTSVKQTARMLYSVWHSPVWPMKGTSVKQTTRVLYSVWHSPVWPMKGTSVKQTARMLYSVWHSPVAGYLHMAKPISYVKCHRKTNRAIVDSLGATAVWHKCAQPWASTVPTTFRLGVFVPTYPTSWDKTPQDLNVAGI
jgi:hypothetical protein